MLLRVENMDCSAISIVCGILGGLIVLLTAIVLEWLRNDLHDKRSHIKYLTQIRATILNADFFVANTLNNKILSPNAEIDVNMFGLLVNKIGILLYDKYLFYKKDEIEVIEKIKELMVTYQVNALKSTVNADKIKFVMSHGAEMEKVAQLVQEQKDFVNICSNCRAEWNNLIAQINVSMKNRFVKA